MPESDSSQQQQLTSLEISKRSIPSPDSIYFTPSQVSLHNSQSDIWCSWLGNVYNLTPLAQSHAASPLLAPILRNAGMDISHWFDPKTSDLKSHINPLTGCPCAYTPDGRFVDVPPQLPRTDWTPANVDQTPWWLDTDTYRIGRLSLKTRRVVIVNTLTGQNHTLEVASEEKVAAIQERYMAINSHAKGYMWKRLGNLLDMNGTLEANGMADLAEAFERVGMDEDAWLPAIHLYFSDDLTVA